jgi:hypothetical protein
VKQVVGAGVLLGAVLLAAGCQHALNPDNGRCGPTPRLVVGNLAFAGDAGGGGAQLVVREMVLDGSDLYFVANVDPAPSSPVQASGAGVVMQVSTYGGTPTVIAGGAGFARPALTASTVILAELGVSSLTGRLEIDTVPRGGGTPTTVTFSTSTVLFAPPVTDGTSVYYADGNGVEAVPLAPASPPVTPTQLSPIYPNNLGVFGQSLLMLLPTGAIEGLPLGAGDAGTETSLGIGFASTPETLIPCGSDACWLAGPNIQEIAPAGGTVATTATLGGPVAAPTMLAFDGTNFFVAGTAGTSTGTAAIARVPRQGGPQVVVATLPSAGPIAVDDACVYFASSTGIFSLQKNAEGVVLP